MRRLLAFVLFALVLSGGSAYAVAPNDLGWGQQWHLRTIHADLAWTKSRGAGIVVAVVDTGVDRTHPDLTGRLTTGRNFVDAPAGGDGNWDDQQGHGTFMAGLIAASTGNTTGVASVAPLAKIMPIRVLDSKGSGKPEVVAEGIDWAIAHGARVINLSLAQEPIGGASVVGSNLFGDPVMDEAIRNAANAGALVLAAAGNTFSGTGGTSTTSYDATVGGVLVVGASTRNDRRAKYSNYGPGLDVLAPGGGSSTSASNSSCQPNSPVVSTWWEAEKNESAYGAGCGTSMAVAHVSGIGALLMARGRSNTSAAARIRSTAVDLYTAGVDRFSGWGRVDAAAAVGAIAVAPRPKPKTRPQIRTTGRPNAVGAAGPPRPAVKDTQIGIPSPSPSLRGLALSAAPTDPHEDPRIRLAALALALAVGVSFANVTARRRAETTR